MRKPRVLIACEYSARMREAFIANGCDAVSCDFLETEVDGPHYQGNVLDIIHEPWDAMIAHPDCTYLCNSGVRWLHEREGRWEKMREGADFFRLLLCGKETSHIPLKAVENPVMHKYGVEAVGRRHDFTCQPWEFGDPYKKRTCFWTVGLPALRPTLIVPESQRIAAVHTASPGPERWKERSRTYPGLAKAAGAQWSKVIKLHMEKAHA